MSSRIIRVDDRINRITVSSALENGTAAATALLSDDHITKIEKEAFEHGYCAGERSGKQMGERMVDAVMKRYDRGIQDIVESHRTLIEAMEKQTVQLALAVSRKLIQREVNLDSDFVAALASVALKRVQSHQSIVLRVSPFDFERVRELTAESHRMFAVSPDPSLERGDFMLDTAQTHFDGRISSQIEAIGRALLLDE
jgi:flagellar assembly protein FliH